MKRVITADQLRWLDNLAKGSEGLKVEPPLAADILAHLRILNRALQAKNREAKAHRRSNPSYGRKYRESKAS